MLAAKPNNKRYLEAIQLLLTLVSTCAVADTIRVDTHPASPPGYYAGHSQERGASRDRRLADLARSDRKRRESEQQATRAGALRIELSSLLAAR